MTEKITLIDTRRSQNGDGKPPRYSRIHRLFRLIRRADKINVLLLSIVVFGLAATVYALFYFVFADVAQWDEIRLLFMQPIGQVPFGTVLIFVFAICAITR